MTKLFEVIALAFLDKYLVCEFFFYVMVIFFKNSMTEVNDRTDSHILYLMCRVFVLEF